MFVFRAALVAVVLSAAWITTAHGAGPKKQWRPATEADIQRKAIPGPILALPASPAATDWSPGQRAYIDPVTNAIVPAPVFATEPEVEGVRRAEPKFTLRRTPQGFLYVDTTGYENVETATLDADGVAHLSCSDLLHAHAPAQPPTDATGPAPASGSEQQP